MYNIICILYIILHVGGQNAVINTVQPMNQERLCLDQTVVLECRLLDPTTSLSWQTPNGTISFSVLSNNGTTRTSDDGKFSATLIENIQIGEESIFTSTLTVLPPLKSNMLICSGNRPSGTLKAMTEIILSGMFMHTYVHVHCTYISILYLHTCICRNGKCIETREHLGLELYSNFNIPYYSKTAGRITLLYIHVIRSRGSDSYIYM